MQNSINLPIARTPRGVNAKPVLMRLTEDELTQLKEISSAECSSMSRIARMLFLDGLKQYKSSLVKKQEHSTDVE